MSDSRPPKRKRRGYQFSLRTLFVLLTVLCVCIGWFALKVHRANERWKAVAWVREMGGVAYYDYEYDADGHSVDDAKSSGPKWLVRLLDADYFQGVSGVNLDGSTVSDLTPLEELKNLRGLSLSDTQVGDQTPLAKLTSLRWLWLNDTQVNDLTPLAKLTRLEYVSCNSSQVSDLTPLAKLAHLERLEVNDTPVCDLAPAG